MDYIFHLPSLVVQMPCEYCKNTSHTLLHCPVVKSRVENIYIYLLEMASDTTRNIYDIKVFIGRLETPVLKRLVKLLDGGMCQPRSLLEDYCFKKITRVRSHILERRASLPPPGQPSTWSTVYNDAPTPVPVPTPTPVPHTPSSNRLIYRPSYLARSTSPTYPPPPLPPRIKVFLQNDSSLQNHDSNLENDSSNLENHRPLGRPFGRSLDNCSICLEQSYIVTNCQHTFCNCILQHLARNNISCPNCRQDIHSLKYIQADKYDITENLMPLLPISLQERLAFAVDV